MAGSAMLPVLGLLVVSSEEAEALELGAPFADRAVLQRGMKVPVWGWSAPGTKVTVAFGGQAKGGVADLNGKWLIELDPLAASAEPREMVVAEASGSTVRVRDVLVGEVWLASGQSNMQWAASKSSCSELIKRVTEEAEAKGMPLPPIRECTVTDVFSSLHPIEHATGEWKVDDFGEFSAIAFAFALKLHESLEVPIGILNCSFSSTSIEAWTPRIGFRDGKDDYTRNLHERILETDPATPQHRQAWGAYFEAQEEILRGNAARIAAGMPALAVSTKTPGNLNGNRDASWLFNARMNPVVPYAIRGAIWNQGYANMGGGITYYQNLHSLVRGWRLVWERPELPVYFHQFYSPGPQDEPSIGSTAEMRMGTWLARDIPHTGMASQIDIEGSIHYWNKAVPGQRLALHALKNQYAEARLADGTMAGDLVADGPMFKSYTVDGNRLIVEFEHAEGGLVVAETGSNSDRRNKEGTGFADPKVLANGEDQVKLFYLADDEGVWHQATVKIEGETVVLTAPGVSKPRGVSYGTGGVGFRPNLYNRALLPMTPFIVHDHKLVTSESWPDDALEVEGVEADPDAVGLKAEWYKMPLLSTQFRDNAVLQAGVPITFWGSALHDHGYEAEGEAVIKFSFNGIEKTIPLDAGPPEVVELGAGESRFSWGREWRVTVPPMEASAEPKSLKVTFLIDGEVAHERVCTNLVVGDVWFVACPKMDVKLPAVTPGNGMVRVMTRKAKRSSHPAPSRYSVAVSRTPKNRFASEWTVGGTGLGAYLGQQLHARTGKPVGIIFMENVVSKEGTNPELKSWIAADCLQGAPSLRADFEDLAAVRPGNPYYDANVRRYLAAWKRYWSEEVPELIDSKAVPEGAAWGSYPALAAEVTSKASETYNVLVHSFTPCSLKGVVFLASEAMVARDGGAHYGSELAVLANCWKARFGLPDPHFLYTMPSRELAPRIGAPEGIKGRSTGIELKRWLSVDRTSQGDAGKAQEELLRVLAAILEHAR